MTRRKRGLYADWHQTVLLLKYEYGWTPRKIAELLDPALTESQVQNIISNFRVTTPEEEREAVLAEMVAQIRATPLTSLGPSAIMEAEQEESND